MSLIQDLDLYRDIESEQGGPLRMDPGAYFGGGHGWVAPRQDGNKARCGGPSICELCRREAEYEAKKPPSYDQLANVTFYTSADGSEPVNLPADAILLEKPQYGRKTWMIWPANQPDIIAISDDLFEQNPDLISNFPFAMEKIDCFKDAFRGCTYWRRTDRSAA